MDRLDEGMLRALLRVARRTAGGDPAAALQLAVDGARREPALASALAAGLADEGWGRLVREELARHRARPARVRDDLGLALPPALRQAEQERPDGSSEARERGGAAAGRFPLPRQSLFGQPRPAPSLRRTLLVVEHNLDVRDLVRAIVERGGHRVVEAADGAEALALVERVRPDLILLDVNVPGTDGLEVCRRLRAGAATRTLPVLLMTAATDSASRQRGLAAGADDCVTKPFRPDDLLARVVRLGAAY